MRHTLLAAVAALAFANFAAADTLVYSETFDSTDFSITIPADGNSHSPVFTLAINQFDPGLGTLNSVSFAYSFQFSFNGNSGPSGGGTSAGTDTGPFRLSNEATFYSQTNGSGNGASPNSNFSFNFVVGPESGALGALGNVGYVASFLVGTAPLSITWEPTISLSPGSGVTGTLALGSGSMSLTYDYTPVPEPSAFAALAGLAVLGATAASRYRRRA